MILIIDFFLHNKRAYYKVVTLAFFLVFVSSCSTLIEYEDEFYARYNEYVIVKKDADRFLKEGVKDENGYYIVEGDLLLTEEEIKDYDRYLATDSITKKAINRNESSDSILINTLSNGKLDLWPVTENTELTYAINTSWLNNTSFSKDEYKVIVEKMRTVVEEWNALCDSCHVKFKHLIEYDGRPSYNNVDFIVRKVDVEGKYIATSFYPSLAKQRHYINIDNSFFDPNTNYDQSSILRHILGHVLGYRHQQTDQLGACRSAWTEYTPIKFFSSSSVMHRPCEGIEQFFTSIDGDSHTLTYTNRDSSHSVESTLINSAETIPDDPEYGSVEVLAVSEISKPDKQQYSKSQLSSYSVRFQGGNMAEYADKVIRLLSSEKGLINSKTVVVKDAKSTCGTYYKTLVLKLGCEKAVKGLAKALNGNISIDQLKTGQKFNIPALNVNDFIYKERFYLDQEPDIQRINNMLKNWDNFVDKKLVKDLVNKRASNYLVIEMRGFAFDFLDFNIDDATKATKLLWEQTQLKNGLPAKHVRFNWNVGRSKVAYYFENNNENSSQNESCSIGNPKNGKYSSLVYSKASSIHYTSSNCVKRSGANIKRPSVMIIDNTIAEHPDLQRALASKKDWKTIVRNNKPCSDLENASVAHHGTHLACIVACENDVEKLDFIGLCPNAEIKNLLWENDEKDSGQLEYDIGKFGLYNKNTGLLRTYLFASEFLPSRDRDDLDEESDLAKHRVDIQLQNSLALVITAAGQPQAGNEPEKITSSSKEAPRNRGNSDQAVVVVTACENCNSKDSVMYKKSNYAYDQDYIHLAAPGIGLNGIATSTEHAFMGGTSQSAAFVAGLASAMIANDGWDEQYENPLYYDRASKVKIRLQVTSHPFKNIMKHRFKKKGNRMNKDKMKEMSGGVVDVNLALLNPSKSWIKTEAGPWEPFIFMGWCNYKLNLKPRSHPYRPGEPEWQVNTSDIHRISKWGSTKSEKWIIYKNTGETLKNGVINIAGPGYFQKNELKGIEGKGHPIFAMKKNESADSNGIDNIELLFSNNFTDFILSKTEYKTAKQKSFSCEEIIDNDS